MSSVKNVLFKASYRKQAYKAAAPDIPLPPEPIITRWGTCLRAVSYYTKHLETVRNVVSTFDPKSAASTQIAQDVLKKQEIEAHSAFISAIFSHFTAAFVSMEAGSSTFCDLLNLFKLTVSKFYCPWKSW
mgnify:CR=1 FL=1